MRFGSWLCSHLQVKILILVGPIEGLAQILRNLIESQPDPETQCFNLRILKYE
jgi:hypothetical protein